MVKAFVMSDGQGKTILPYVEPKDLYGEQLKLIRVFDFEADNIHYAIAEVKQTGKDVTLYVALQGANSARVCEVLKWDQKRPIDFRIVRREYTLVREGEVATDEAS